MAAALTAVAKAVAAKIEKVPIQFEYVGSRSYGDFKELLEDLDKLHIDVFGETYDDSDLEDRASVRHIVTIGIAVRKRFDVADQNTEPSGSPRFKIEEIDDLVGVTQALFDFWLTPASRVLADDEYSISFDGEPRIVFNPSRKALMENHQFLGLVRMTFRTSKPL